MSTCLHVMMSWCLHVIRWMAIYTELLSNLGIFTKQLYHLLSLLYLCFFKAIIMWMTPTLHCPAHCLSPRISGWNRNSCFCICISVCFQLPSGGQGSTESFPKNSWNCFPPRLPVSNIISFQVKYKYKYKIGTLKQLELLQQYLEQSSMSFQTKSK